VITANQLVAHAVGDYLFQSHWMAQEKTRARTPAIVHAVTYTLAFLPLTRSPWRLASIAATHFLIDRYRLTRYVVWAKNQMTPRNSLYRPTRGEFATLQTGYPIGTPPWLAVWLLIIADSTIHVLLNSIILCWRS
jgi:hypothetical protein